MNNIVMMRGRAMNRIMRPGINPTVKKPAFPIGDRLGPELIVNGDFATDSDWVKGDGWTIAGGEANCDGTQIANSNLQESVNSLPPVGSPVVVTYTVSNYIAGAVSARAGFSGIGANYAANGTYTETYTVGGNTLFFIIANSIFIGSIDNISVKEVLS